MRWNGSRQLILAHTCVSTGLMYLFTFELIRNGKLYYGCLQAGECVWVWNVCRFLKGRCNAVWLLFLLNNFFSFVRAPSLQSVVVHASFCPFRGCFLIFLFYFSWSHNYGCYIWFFSVRFFFFLLSQWIFCARALWALAWCVRTRWTTSHTMTTGSRTKKGNQFSESAVSFQHRWTVFFYFVLLCFICSRQQ